MNTNSESTRKERWVTLDILKGIGVIGMIIIHCLVWWYVYPVNRMWYTAMHELFPILFFTLGSLVLFIPIASGAALRFSFEKGWDWQRQKLAIGSKPYVSTIIQRGVLLAALGFLMNLLAWGVEDLLTWNVLQFYALAIFVISIILKILSISWLIVLGLISYVSIIFIEYIQAFFPPHFITTILVGNIDKSDIWPLLPWIYLPILGLIIAHFYIKTESKYHFRIASLLIGLIAFGISVVFLLRNPLVLTYSFNTIWDIAIQPPFFFLTGMVAVFLIATAALDFARTVCNLSYIAHPFIVIGRQILIIYILHMITAFWYFSKVVTQETSSFYFWVGLLLQIAMALFVGYSVWALQKLRNEH